MPSVLPGQSFGSSFAVGRSATFGLGDALPGQGVGGHFRPALAMVADNNIE